MTVSTHRRQLNPSTRSRRRTQALPPPPVAQPQPQARPESGSLFAYSLQASLIGGVGILALMLLGLIPVSYLAFLVMPGYPVIWLCTGLLAGIFAGEVVRSTMQGGKVGWMAGFWAGIYGGIIAMILAAFNLLPYPALIGQNIVAQFSPDQLAALTSYGLAPATLALMGRVFGALVIYGLMGALVSALFSSVGGMVYAKIAN